MACLTLQLMWEMYYHNVVSCDIPTLVHSVPESDPMFSANLHSYKDLIGLQIF